MRSGMMVTMVKSHSRRRWFSFRLRTLFVLVAIVACAVAWIVGEVRFVKQREKFLYRLYAKEGYIELTSDDLPAIPWWRELLGDVGIELLRVPYTCEAEFRTEAQRLYPEASLIAISKEEMEQNERDRQKQKEDEEEAKRLRVMVEAGLAWRSEPMLIILPVPNGKPVSAKVDHTGAIHLLFDTAGGPKYAKSTDNGKSFGEAIPVVDRGSRRTGLEFHGADMAVGKDGTVHVAMGTNAWKLKLPKSEWAMFYARLQPGAKAFSPVRNLNSHPSEGFSLAADDKGNVTACWLSGKLYANVSHDSGKTFAPKVEIDATFDPCDCCTTSAIYGTDGKLAVLYREETGNERDMYLILWDQDRSQISRTRISIAPWKIDACPMSAYAVSRTPDGFLAVWPTKGQIYFVRLDNKGGAMQPGEVKTDGTAGMHTGMLGMIAPDGTTLVAWKKDDQLHWQLFDPKGKPIGPPDSARRPGNGVAGVVSNDGRFVLFK